MTILDSGLLFLGHPVVLRRFTACTKMMSPVMSRCRCFC